MSRRLGVGALRGGATLAPLLAGCGGMQSTLDPAGLQAERIDRLWWLYFWVSVVVYVIVMAFITWAVMRRRGGSNDPTPVPAAAAERLATRIISAATALTVVTLFVLLVGDFLTGRAVRSLDVPDALVVRMTARQWWWEVQYPGSSPHEIVTTANELHLPVGRPVRIELVANDVIHSFWVPNLHGKKDMIPGHPTTIVVQADRPGEFRGQCAEFCGLQHANMRFVVIAEPEAAFRSWLDGQGKPAPEPMTDARRRGREVFLGSSCVLCHTIQGTIARGTVGPNLTHVGSRPRIASGMLPNTRGHLSGWVADPHSIKPGVRMPSNPLPPDDFRALLDYLESLK
jgi:cytochrome c oxidase subunit II